MTFHKHDVFIFTEYMASRLQVDGATVFLLRQQEGFKEVFELIKNGKIELQGFKIVILLMGRADLWISDDLFEEFLYKSIAVIREKFPRVITVLAATLPAPGDTRPTINTANYRSGMMARLAARQAQLEFTKPGKRLIRRPGGAIKEYFDAEGHLNEEGARQVGLGLVAKIDCAHLREKFGENSG